MRNPNVDGVRAFVFVLIAMAIIAMFIAVVVQCDKMAGPETQKVGTVSSDGTTYMPEECRRIIFPAQFGGEDSRTYYYYDPFIDSMFNTVFANNGGSQVAFDKKNILYTPWAKQMGAAREKCAATMKQMEANAIQSPIQYP